MQNFSRTIINAHETAFASPRLMFAIIKISRKAGVVGGGEKTTENIVSDIMKYKLIFCCCGLLRVPAQSNRCFFIIKFSDFSHARPHHLHIYGVSGGFRQNKLKRSPPSSWLLWRKPSVLMREMSIDVNPQPPDNCVLTVSADDNLPSKAASVYEFHATFEPAVE